MLRKKGIVIFIVVLLIFSSVIGCSVQTDAPVANDDSGSSPPQVDESPTGTPQDQPGDGDESDQSQTPGEDEGGDVQPPDSSQEDPGQSDDQEAGVVYISASRLNVRQEPSASSDKVDSLMKGAAVKVLEEKTDDSAAKWYKVSYPGVKEEVTGWIASEFTVADRTELLPDYLKVLDFSPVEKTEYPDNPRVKVRGVYLTIYSAASSNLDKLIEMAKRTEINTFVIDVKDDKGYMLFKTAAAEKYAPEANKHAVVKDIQALMKKLKDNGIHTVARIVSFKDPMYTQAHPDRAITYKDTGKVFTNSDDLAWATAYDRQLWDYNIAVSKEAVQAGFNEVQFDYVRFPASNGGKLDAKLDYRNVDNMSKPQAIQEYLKYARRELSPLHAYISADIYGLVGSVADDMALGQYWEAVSNVVDYVSPMMYPSHYANGTYGLSVPDAYPYETVFSATRDSVSRNQNVKYPAIIRPWIQDFTATSWVEGAIPYREKEVRAQIRALKDNGVEEYLLWDANNTYTDEALTGNYED